MEQLIDGTRDRQAVQIEQTELLDEDASCSRVVLGILERSEPHLKQALLAPLVSKHLRGRDIRDLQSAALLLLDGLTWEEPGQWRTSAAADAINMAAAALALRHVLLRRPTPPAADGAAPVPSLGPAFANKLAEGVHDDLLAYMETRDDLSRWSRRNVRSLTLRAFYRLHRCVGDVMSASSSFWVSAADLVLEVAAAGVLIHDILRTPGRVTAGKAPENRQRMFSPPRPASFGSVPDTDWPTSTEGESVA